MKKVYVLNGTYGEYSDKVDLDFGVFESKELAEKAKEDILLNADRTVWPWTALSGITYAPLDLGIWEVELNKLVFPLKREIPPLT